MTIAERLARQGTSAVLIAVTVGFITVSYAYSEDVRELPLLIAWSTLVLLVVEFVSQGDTRIGRKVHAALSSKGAEVPSFDQRPDATLAREVSAFAWVFGVLAAVVLFGFFITIPVYVASFLRIRAGVSLKIALPAAAALTGGLYGLFEILLGYRLFYGFLMGDF